MIKKRRMATSERGIYIQDSELSNTNFKVGEHYRYILDVKSRKMYIISSDNEKDNKVSKRVIDKANGKIKPVIDIRKKSIKDAFKNADYLQLTIKKDIVIVEAFSETEETFIDKAISLVKGITRKTKKVISITDLIKVRKTAEVVMSSKKLQNVVGFEQISLDLENLIEPTIERNVYSKGLKERIKNLDIPLKVVSLFSGAGLLDKGFIDNGFDIVFATDISKEACKTYSENIGDHIVCADIRELHLNSIPKAPIVIGGSPCVLYTNSNRKTNLNKQLHKAERIIDIPDNVLLRKYIETVKLNNECVIFVHENVSQVNTIGEGKLIEEIKSELPDFDISTHILNGEKYGPQKRKRSILIGSKIGQIQIVEPMLHAMKSVRDAFEGLNNEVPNQLDYSRPKPLTLERIKSVPSGGNVFDIPLDYRPSGQHSDYFRRLEWDKPSITIVNPRKSMILHPEEDRILTVRECARLQGLKDSFVFFGTLASKQLQVANGVPYGMSYAIANAVKEALLNRLELLNKSNIAFAM